MTNDSASREDELVSQASGHFSEKALSEAEKKLLRAAHKGIVAICGPKFDDHDPTNDPAKADGWGGEREIRADLIRWICAERDQAVKIDPRGIQVYAGKITGKLDLSYVSVAFPLGFNRCSFCEEADLTYLKTSELDFGGSWTRALNLDGVNVGGDLSFDEGFHCEGGIRLLTAQIGSNLECNGGTFLNPVGHALWADRTKIAGSAFFGRLKKPGSPVDGAIFTAKGTVRLVGAQIGGVLSCSGGMFHEPVPHGNPCMLTPSLVGTVPVAQGSSYPIQALNCDRMKVLNIFLDKDFLAEGEVMLRGVDIGINLVCTDGRFTNPNGDAFSADGAKIGGGVYLDGKFVAQGEVDLLNCLVGGDVVCTGGSFTKLNLTRATIKGSFIWSNVSNAGTAQLDLTNTTTGPLEDAEASWPQIGNLSLDGFCYSRISQTAPGDVETRLRWLSRLPRFSMQPYQQLAKVLREGGDAQGAHRVIFKMEHQRRQGQDTSGFQKIASRILQWTIGYGQMPLRALWWLLALTMLGCTIFGLGYLGGGITPRDKEAYAVFQQQGYAPDYHPQFNPLIYSLEHSFPLVNLSVKDGWGPNPGGPGVLPVVNFELLRWMQETNLRICSAGSLRWWMWIQTLVGWVLATLFVAGLTGIVKSG